jgi:hypothetical protein
VAPSATPLFCDLGGFMENQSRSNSSAAGSPSATQREGRGAWVLTAYGISGLALFGILIYYFSNYITH